MARWTRNFGLLLLKSHWGTVIVLFTCAFLRWTRLRYVIRALESAGSNESWSSPVDFDFKHPVKIPIIITPNGDEFNQYFHIGKIQLYKNSELTIVDRWGKEVLRRINYQNDWDGDGLSSGVYFYVLDLKKDNKVYKDTLTIF